MSNDNGATRRWQFSATAAQRLNILLRFGLCGAGGSGKSYSAMAIACALALRLKLGPVFVIDSENASALRYAPSTRSGRGFAFQHVPMPTDDYSPESYCGALDFCEAEGARVIVIDSISHEYDGPGGILEIVDEEGERAAKSGRGRDNFSGWKVATPRHKRFLQRLNSVRAHLFFTVRAKTAYEMRDDPKRPGKQSFQKVGLGPVQREGIEYEPDLFAWMVDAALTVDKTRVDTLDPGSVWERPGADVAAKLADWIEDVAPPQPEVVADDASIAESLAIAIRGALEAPSREARAEIRDRLMSWCKDNGVPSAKAVAVRAEFMAKLRAAAQPQSPPAVDPDEAAARAIDQGAA